MCGALSPFPHTGAILEHRDRCALRLSDWHFERIVQVIKSDHGPPVEEYLHEKFVSNACKTSVCMSTRAVREEEEEKQELSKVIACCRPLLLYGSKSCPIKTNDCG
jgi:hypothetical protein